MKTGASRLAVMFPIGKASVFRQTVTSAMVKTYGDLIDDHDPLHFDDEFCKRTIYGRPVAHGTLIVGFMSAASTAATRDSGIPLASLGYDRIRFVGPVFPGDETCTSFTIVGHDEARKRITADVKVHVGERLVAIASNVLKLID